MQRKYSAYLTVYLSLVFGIVLSLLFVLIEGAATGAARAQSELVADLGLDSVFAEYNREVLNQYELFFMDASYGSENGGISMVEKPDIRTVSSTLSLSAQTESGHPAPAPLTG